MVHSLRTVTVKGSEHFSPSEATLELVHDDQHGHSVEVLVENRIPTDHGGDNWAVFYAGEDELKNLIQALQAKLEQLQWREHTDTGHHAEV